MPNYSLVIDSTFKPFTYQELAAPLDRAELYHEKLAQEYDNLSKQADVLEAMGKNDRDVNSKSYSQYKAYSDSLRDEADNLYRFGLNTESRQRLSNLRRRYNTEIVPIQNAWNKREEEAKMQLSATMQNPSIMFTRDADKTTLDEYIANPMGGYGVISGANITAQMSQMAKNLAKQVRGHRKEGIDDLTYNYISEHGLTEDMIRDWRNYPTLKRMFEQVMQANGVTPEALEGSMNAQNIVAKSTNYAEMGMWDAMGEDKEQFIVDKAKEMAMQEAKERRMENLRHGHAMAQIRAQKAGDEDLNMPNVTSVGVGLSSTDQYAAKNLGILNGLKAGYNALKRSLFGSTIGDVNPMKIYDEYQEAIKKYSKESRTKLHREEVDDGRGGVITAWVSGDSSGNIAKRAREDIMKKYAKYGVSDILSKEQYNALSSLGYSAKKNITSHKHSDLIQDFNKTVTQKTRYSTNMANYDSFNEKAIPNLVTRAEYGQDVGTIWKYTGDGQYGKPVRAKSINFKDYQVTDVQYDPQYKGKIVVQVTNKDNTDGGLYVMDPSVYDSNLSNMINYWENQGAPAEAITANIYNHLNERNKVNSKTDSKIE